MQARDAELLAGIALNGTIAARWWHDPPRRTMLDEAHSWPNFPLHRLAVSEAGLYRISGNSIAGNAFIGQPSSKIKLFGNGGRLLPINPGTPIRTELVENSILVFDGGDGIFHSGDSILFYGEGLKGPFYTDTSHFPDAHHSPFSTENTYFIGLDAGGPDGLRMSPIPAASGGAAVSSSSAREYHDQDVFIYAGNSQPESGLVWYWTAIDPGLSRSLSLTLGTPVNAPASLRIDLASRGAPGNTFYIFVNNQEISSGYYVSIPFSVQIPAGVLRAGNNVVRLENRSAAATIYVNFVEIDYDRTLSASGGVLSFRAPRNATGLYSYALDGLTPDALILDVTNPLAPRYARGTAFMDSSWAGAERQYYAASTDRLRIPTYRGLKSSANLDYTRLRDPSNTAGIILLTYDAWYGELDSLVAFHATYREEPLRAIRVRLSDVFDEFGWGVRDMVAIRNFLKYAYENWRGPAGDEPPVKYVLFIGDGDYDYRNLESNADDNWMPPWEWGEKSLDDFYCTFSGGGGLPDLLSGRWPVQNAAELRAIISKTIAYAAKPLYGPWKATATLAADDEYTPRGCSGEGGEGSHTSQAENLVNRVFPGYFNNKKIYEIFYPPRPGPTGTTKPEATRDLLETINRGTLLINYTGHGNERVWTDEQLFVMDRDRNLLDNYRKWPLFLAATCTWGGYDRPTGRCFPEILLADTRDGAVTCLAATRFTFIGSNNDFTNAFYTELFRPGLASRRSFGEALVIGKSSRITAADLYHVFGDPVLRLATPEYFARITSRDDSLRPLALYNMSGEVSRTDTGAAWADFQGVIEVHVFDTEDSVAHYWCGNTGGSPRYIRVPGNAIFRGTASVRNGRFDVTFRVPRDVQYGGTNSKSSLYFFGKADSAPDSADGIGIQERLAIASQPSAEQDSIPPVITAWLEVPSFRPGDLVSRTPRLFVTIADSSGINLSGQVGHKIAARVDDAQAEDMTPFFNYHRDSHTTGSLEKVIGPLTPGEHRLVIEAWDSFNNLNQLTMTFVVGEAGEGGYAVKDVYNWPNPMTDATHFTYYLTQEGTRRVSLKVFTLSGKLVYEMDNLGTRGPAFNSNADRPWDGRDREGHLLANGVYFYRIRAEHSSGRATEATGKLAILR